MVHVDILRSRSLTHRLLNHCSSSQKWRCHSCSRWHLGPHRPLGKQRSLVISLHEGFCSLKVFLLKTHLVYFDLSCLHCQHFLWLVPGSSHPLRPGSDPYLYEVAASPALGSLSPSFLPASGRHLGLRLPSFQQCFAHSIDSIQISGLVLLIGSFSDRRIYFLICERTKGWHYWILVIRRTELLFSTNDFPCLTFLNHYNFTYTILMV